MEKSKQNHKDEHIQPIDFKKWLSFNSDEDSDKFDFTWFYQIKEVDRRLSYHLVKESSSICDVGGAQGVDSFVFAEKGAFVIDLDINGYALELGNKKAHALGLKENFSFIKGSATALPFKSGVIDLITCFSTLDHLPNKESAYTAVSEFSRVVRKKGHVVITVPSSWFLIGTLSMKIKNLTEPSTFREQRFTPKELSHVLLMRDLTPITFDSEFPRLVDRSLLLLNFPKFFRNMPGILPLTALGAKLLNRLSEVQAVKWFGARVGYLSVKF